MAVFVSTVSVVWRRRESQWVDNIDRLGGVSLVYEWCQQNDVSESSHLYDVDAKIIEKKILFLILFRFIR